MNIILNKFLVSLKNTTLITKDVLVINYNKTFLPILSILYEEGFLLNYVIVKQNIIIRFRYFYGYNSLKNLKIISNISKSIFLNRFELIKIYDKTKLMVLSTSKGILTSFQCKKLKIGGEVLFIC